MDEALFKLIINVQRRLAVMDNVVHELNDICNDLVKQEYTFNQELTKNKDTTID